MKFRGRILVPLVVAATTIAASAAFAVTAVPSTPAVPTPPTRASVAAVASTLLLMDMKQFLSWNLNSRTLRTTVPS